MVDHLLVATAAVVWLAVALLWGYVFTTRWREIVTGLPGDCR